MNESNLTEFITLTEMWQDCNYELVAKIIDDEKWPPNRLGRFFVYFRKYLGEEESTILCKLLR